MVLNDKQKEGVVKDFKFHSEICCENVGHGIAFASNAIYLGEGFKLTKFGAVRAEKKWLEINQAVALELIKSRILTQKGGEGDA